MGQATDKATRRELRRAVGLDGLAAMQDHAQALAILQSAVATSQREIAALALDHASLKESHRTLLETVIGHANQLSAFHEQTRTFRQRLRWLWSGR